MTPKKTIILADAHLRGENDPHQKAMVDFLDRCIENGEHLIILGDFFEYLAGRNQESARSYRPVLKRLALCPGLDYLEGNHDFDIDPGFPGLEKARIHPGQVDLKIGSFASRLFHGDGSSPGDLGTRILRIVLQSGVIRTLRDRILPHGLVFRFALGFASFSRKRVWPGRSDESGHVEQRALTEVANPEIDLVIFAHTHNPVLKQTPQGIVANPGAAGPFGTYLEVRENRLRLCRFPLGQELERLHFMGRYATGKAAK
jgi:UDP-2,3-diacylglucosamine pyrophosphatase LpxH